MIKVTDLSKNFGELKALDKVSFSVPKGSILGLVGANGAGKSTLMRIIAGIYTADDGSVLINDEPVYDNPAAKTHLVFVPDRMHLTGGGATIERMANFYASCYPKFSFEKFDALLNIFKLDKKRRVRSLSKGMVRQVQTVLALSCNADVLLFDETFDGLDPIARNIAKRLIYRDMCDFGSTVILTITPCANLRTLAIGLQCCIRVKSFFKMTLPMLNRSCLRFSLHSQDRLRRRTSRMLNCFLSPSKAALYTFLCAAKQPKPRQKSKR